MIPFLQLWVRAFRQGLLEIVVNTNNGVERKNKDFKHEFLKPYKDNSLSGVVTVLVQQLMPVKGKSKISSYVLLSLK